jgi:flagellar hook assembly protein FlgD
MVATYTPVPAPSGGAAGGSVIAFSSLPVNIDASFGDGPGVYQCEIVDSQGTHVNTVFNKRVSFEKQTWISWDATNDQGQQVRYGMYYAVFTKDGKLIRKIPLNWGRGQ